MNKPHPNPCSIWVKPLFLLRTWLFLLLLSALGTIQSANAQTHGLTSTWSMAPNNATFMNTTNHLTRGMTYNPATGHLLVVSRTPTATQTNAIYVLDSTTGATLGTLPFDSGLITGGTFPINMVGVTTDGVIYVCNLTTDSTNVTSGPFKLYRWANESASPTLAYTGDPSFLNTNGASPRRFGDSMAVRGTGAGTQILLGTLNQTVSLLTTADGATFTAKSITTDGEVSDTRWGLAWGAGDTFWAKQASKNLKRFSLNIAAGTATVTQSILLPTYPGGSVVAIGGPLDIDLTRNLVAVVDTTNHKLRVYDISNPASAVQTDWTRDMPAANANGNGVGAVYMKNGLLFALETNDGIRAYTVQDGVVVPPQVALQPTSPPSSVWEGAYWSLTTSALGTPPLTYQWQRNGVDVPDKTSPVLEFNITTNDAGSWRLVVANSSGSVTSSAVTIPNPVSGNATAQVTNIWDILPLTRQYVGTNYTEYGIAINPVNTNVIVLTKANPTNMIVVLDPRTGAEKYYIDYSPLLPLSSAWNKVDVADDGTIYLCNLTGNTTTAPFRIDALMNDGPNPTLYETGRALYEGDPGNGVTTFDVVWGITMSVRGSSTNAQILLGSGSYNKSSRTVAILQADSSGVFTSTPVTVADAPDKFGRLGLDWGPGTNTFWAKSAATTLILVEFDINNGTGFVKKSFPLTGSRSVPSSVTGIKYDRNFNLLAGLQNGSPPSPVSVPIYNVANVDAGPLWVDQELYKTYNAEVNYQGNVDFANGYLVAMGGNNGIKAFKVKSDFVPRPVIVSQPAGGVWFDNASSPTISVVADANTALTYQWYRDTELLVGETRPSLTVTNITASQAGNYWVRVSSGDSYLDSKPATLSVVPLYNTAQMTNIWSVQAGTRPYLNTYYYDYGMSFNPATSNILVASCVKTNPTPVVIGVMDALTGADKWVLNVDAIDMNSSINRYVNKIGVADDGVVYAGNRTTSPTTVPFVVYRWANDQPDTVATEAFRGDPFATMAPNKNCGWTMEVRGAGVNTEIMMSTSASNVVSILKTTDGSTFTANEILVPGVPNSFCRLGICFGAGNTFWAKAWQGDGGQLRLVQYDLAAKTGTVLKTYTNVSSTMTTVAYNDTLKFLGGIARDDQKNMMLYNVADLESGPVLLDQEVFPTYNPSIEANGALDFGGNTYLFGLNENNGVMAMLINPDYVPSVKPFSILSTTATGNTLTITWKAETGATYQVQQVSALGGSWENVGSPIVATGTTASYSETIVPGPRFYRVRSQNP